jgi:YHS domain-containing protein
MEGLRYFFSSPKCPDQFGGLPDFFGGVKWWRYKADL